MSERELTAGWRCDCADPGGTTKIGGACIFCWRKLAEHQARERDALKAEVERLRTELGEWHEALREAWASDADAPVSPDDIVLLVEAAGKDALISAELRHRARRDAEDRRHREREREGRDG